MFYPGCISTNSNLIIVFPPVSDVVLILICNVKMLSLDQKHDKCCATALTSPANAAVASYL